MTWLFIILGALVGLIVIVVGVGMLLPQNHSASRTAMFMQPPEVVWQAITDHANEPSWRTDITKKERLDDRNGHAVWRETSKRGEVMTFETIVFEPPRKMIGRIADTNLPFGGAWTYEIKPIDGTRGCCRPRPRASHDPSNRASSNSMPRSQPIAFSVAPATAVILGWLVLREPMTLSKAAGVTMILAGVILLTGGSQQAAGSGQPSAVSDRR